MEVSSFAVGLAGGRSLEVSVSGPQHATPLVLHHGTPSDRTQYPPFAQAAAARGLRLVTYSRPGYGGSARQPDRVIADCAADALAIVKQLGAGRFYTAGWSGGGPHALACAALLGDRVLACATIAGVGPFGAAGLNFLEGMGRDNQEEFGAALAGPSRLQDYLERHVQVLAEVTGVQVAAALGDLVTPVDVGALTGDFAAYLATTFRHAVSTGIWGWFDDDLAFIRPWGFALDEVGVPVVVWQGGQDRMVPFAHGQWLARHVSGARPRLLPEEGHLSIAVASFGKILDDLLEDRPPVGE
jgi:pimeloyl-ACP methyl ester carboxylesterase